ncbi:RNA polymerase sigma factor [Fodinicola acaciae]|uniref:RNA polymerase sigma factor n=1 Tax=Fodinicola acaciae TaxID=2681555 RepID=UPI0013D852DD|nr:sigma-70 family RNA polymerase sigma factor [Fodinicola acaciae]
MLEQLYRDAGRQLVLAAYALTGDITEAQDAVQEAFVRACARPGMLDDTDNPVAWMRTVTLNIARDRHRRRQRMDRLLRRRRPEDTVPEISPDRVTLLAALRKLPERQREVVALHYLVDLPTEEIAQLLRVPVNTVKSRLLRGKQALAGLLTDRTPTGGRT